MSDSLKLFSLFMLILLCIACYHDLNRDTKYKTEFIEIDRDFTDDDHNATFQVISVRVTNGDHFLTIMEQINQNPSMNMNQSITDFKNLNPSADINWLENERVYLFPLYHQE